MKSFFLLCVLFLASCNRPDEIKSIAGKYFLCYSSEVEDEITVVYEVSKGYYVKVVPSKISTILHNAEYILATNIYSGVYNYYIIPMKYTVDKDIERNFYSFREIDLYLKTLKELNIDTNYMTKNEI